MLCLTVTTLSIQSFMGAIMAIGIAVANSILLVTFAEQARREGRPLLEAVREGATGRLRAGLSRAGSGGLAVSTFATLTILPLIYAILQRRAPGGSPSLNPMDPGSRY